MEVVKEGKRGMNSKWFARSYIFSCSKLLLQGTDSADSSIQHLLLLCRHSCLLQAQHVHLSLQLCHVLDDCKALWSRERGWAKILALEHGIGMVDIRVVERCISEPPGHCTGHPDDSHDTHDECHNCFHNLGSETVSWGLARVLRCVMINSCLGKITVSYSQKFKTKAGIPELKNDISYIMTASFGRS